MSYLNGKESIPAEDWETEILMVSLIIVASVTKKCRAP